MNICKLILFCLIFIIINSFFCYYSAECCVLVLVLELLDEAEFGEAANNVEYDENTINPASDLQLLVCDQTTKLSVSFSGLSLTYAMLQVII